MANDKQYFLKKYLVLHPVRERHLNPLGQVNRVILAGQEYHGLQLCQDYPSDLKCSTKYQM